MLIANSVTTIGELSKLFATHGIPELVVSDNNTVFTSVEFSEFMVGNSIQHLRTVPII